LEFQKNIFAPHVEFAISHLTVLSHPIRCAYSITVKGTKYSKDLYVVAGIDGSELVFGKVILCLADANEMSKQLLYSVC
jgi:hypothetical protein